MHGGGERSRWWRRVRFGVALVVVTVMFPAATAGTILLPLIVYHLAQMVVAAPVAARLRGD